MTWTNLANHIEIAGVDKEKYRETYATAFADDKIYFFGLESVDPTSENFHETCLGGTFVTVFDIKTKHFSTKKFDKVDEDVQKHREHVFAVNDVVLMYVYSKTDEYQKLYMWKNDKWNDSKVTIAGTKVVDSCNFHNGFQNAKDGFYMHFENGRTGYITKLEVVADKGECKSAKLVEVVKENLDDVAQGRAHFTTFAVNDHQVVAWYGQEMCGFRWQPNKPVAGEWSKSTPAKLKPIELADPHPPYAFAGPRNVVMRNDSLVMLGGSTQVGMGHTKDNPEIWVFDLKSNAYRKSTNQMPDVTLWRTGVAFDEHSGNIYLCEREKGIFTANIDSF